MVTGKVSIEKTTPDQLVPFYDEMTRFVEEGREVKVLILIFAQL